MNRLPTGTHAKRRRYSTSAVSTSKYFLYGSSEKNPPLFPGGCSCAPTGGSRGSPAKLGAGTLLGGGGNLDAARQGRDSGVAHSSGVASETRTGGGWADVAAGWLVPEVVFWSRTDGARVNAVVTATATSSRALESQLLLRGLRL